MAMSSVMAALGSLVLERTAEGRFVRCDEPPRWCSALGFPALAGSDPLIVQDLFPYLEVFLPDAERAWRAEARDPAVSDFWTEVGARGEELHLEASALHVDAQDLLVITRNEQLF